MVFNMNPCSECQSEIVQDGPGRPRATCGPACAMARNTRRNNERQKAARAGREADLGPVAPVRYATDRERRDVANKAQNARAQERWEWMRGLKSVPCMDCLGTFPAECMDFDHKSPLAKKFPITRWPNLPKDVLLAEIAKCDIVCSNCHRIRTAAQRKEMRLAGETWPSSKI